MLRGGLWLPDGRLRAALLMYPGSGPSDRNNDGYFPLIRAHLMHLGVAVASFDKRGVGSSTGDWRDADISGQASDALAEAAVLRLALAADVPLGLFGHSQGGWVVLEAAAREAAAIDFVITNSGPGVTTAAQERYSIRRQLEMAGTQPGDVQTAVACHDLAVELMRARVPYADARRRVVAMAPHIADSLVLSILIGQDEAEWKLISALIDHDPQPALERIAVPVLALFGAQDSVVPVPQSVAMYERTVRAGLLTVAVLPGYRSSHSEDMRSHADWMTSLALLSLDGVGIVWLLSAAWFAARLRASARGRVRHFLKTLLPEPWMIVGLPVLLLLLRLLPAGLWQHITYEQTLLQAVGAAMVVGSSLLMVWARLVLGDMWAGRPMVQEAHELRTEGPYRLVRHPIYTGILGAVLGLTLLAGFGQALVVLVFVTGWLLWRVRVEDGLMVATFGDGYRAHQREVPALIPLPRRFRPPAASRA